jgi:hypothetical protein
MKAFKILALTFLCSIVHLNNIFAQTDYVITKNHDTIHCDIKVNFLNGRLKYRANENDKYIKIIPDNVIEYFFALDTSTYVYKKLPGKVYRYTPYLKWLVKGRINLYDQEVASGSKGETSSSWYASKGTDSLVSIKMEGIIIVTGSHKDREKAFMDLISDFPSLLEGFKRKAYTFDNIMECVVVYNSEYSKK